MCLSFLQGRILDDSHLWGSVSPLRLVLWLSGFSGDGCLTQAHSDLCGLVVLSGESEREEGEFHLEPPLMSFSFFTRHLN